MDKKKLYLILLMVCVSFILCAIWFSGGKIIASGESGIIFYNPQAIVNILSHTWGDAILGSYNASVLVTLPFYAFIWLFSSMHVPGFLIQYLVFAGLLLLQSIFSIFLLENVIKTTNNRLLAVGAIFYVFNLITVVSVWNRLQYPFIFFYSFLPLVMYVFMKGIQKRSYLYVIVLNFIFFLFGIVFASIPFIELVWIILFLFTLFFTITNFKDKNLVKFMWIYLIGNLLIWLLWNSWWMLQFIVVTENTSYLTTSAYSASSDLGTFIGLSNRLGNLSYVFRLMNQDFFISMSSLWHGIYDSPFMILLTYCIPALAFFPLLLKKKSKEIYFFLGGSLFFIFFIKGSADPFGGIAIFLFSHIRLLEAFRNSFEKIGLVLPLFYMPLIVFTISFLVNYFKKQQIKYIFPLSVISIFTIIAFPLLNGLVFTSTINPSNNLKQGDQVKVPSYYDAASKLLLNKNEDIRLVALPIGAEGITYNWPYGYSGVELTNNLLGVPAISLDTNVQFLSPIAKQLQYTLLQNPEDFSQLMNVLNAKYLLVRNDINFVYRGMTDPKTIRTILESNIKNKSVNLEKDRTFGELNFYKNPHVSPKIYAASDYSLVSSNVYFSDIFSLLNKSSNNIIVDPKSPGLNSQNLQYVNGEILSPDTTINFSEFPKVKLKDAYAQLPYISILPNNFKYSLLMLKEKFEQLLLSNDRDKYLFYLQSLNKRIAELKAVLSVEDASLIDKAVNNFVVDENNFSNFLNTPNGYAESQGDLYNFRYSMLSQLEILGDLCGTSKNTNICRADSGFEKLAQKFNIKSLYKSKLSLIDPNQRIVYRFFVAHPGDYEVILRKDEMEKYYDNLDLLSAFQIDNLVENKSPQDIGNYLSFGTFVFTSGMHEIQLSIPQAKNLSASQNNNLVINSSTTKPGTKMIAISPFDQFGKYKVSYFSWLESGTAAAVVARNELTLPVGKNYKKSGIDSIIADTYLHGFQYRSSIYTPNPNSIANELEIQVFPYNNCIQANKNDFLLSKQCDWDRSFMNLFNHNSVLYIKNLNVQKEFTNPLFLVKHDKIEKKLDVPQITFVKKSPVEYKVYVKNARTPFFLAFLESFHPLWQAKSVIGGKNVVFNDHFIANDYANAWYITKTGTYTITISFDGETYLRLGIGISVLSILGVAIGYIFYQRRNKNL